MIGNSVAANAPIKALAMIPHMSKEQLEMYARDTSSPLSTFAIARLNAMQIATTKANAGIGPKSTIAQQVLSKEAPNMPPQGIQQVQPQVQPELLAQLQEQPPVQQMAEGGLAHLDTGDMYKEDSFAGGGIVAFSGQDGVSDVASKKYQAWQQDAVLDPSHLYAGAMDAVTAPFKYRVVYDPSTGKFVKAKDLYGYTPRLDALSTERQTEKQNILDSIQQEKVQPGIPSTLPEVPTPKSTVNPDDFDAMLRTSKGEYGDITPGITSLKDNTTKKPVYTKEQGANPEAVKQYGLKDLYRPIPDVSGDYKDMVKDTTGMAEAARDQYRTLLGEDPERADLMKRVQKYETGAAEQERTAPWMALAKAGFSIAGGKSPYAIQNIAEGASVGLSDYVQAKDRLDKLNERSLMLRSELNRAKRAEDVAGATAGMHAKETQETRNQQAQIQSIASKVEVAKTNELARLESIKILNDRDYKGQYIGILRDRLDKADQASKAKMLSALTTANTKVTLDPAYNKRIKALETQWKDEKKIDNPYLDPEFIRQTKNIKSEFVNDYVGQELSNSGAINVTDIDEALKNSP